MKAIAFPPILGGSGVEVGIGVGIGVLVGTEVGIGGDVGLIFKLTWGLVLLINKLFLAWDSSISWTIRVIKNPPIVIINMILKIFFNYV